MAKLTEGLMEEATGKVLAMERTIAKNRMKVRDEIFNKAVEACKKFDGCAQIQDNYFIVDSSKYKIERR